MTFLNWFDTQIIIDVLQGKGPEAAYDAVAINAASCFYLDAEGKINWKAALAQSRDLIKSQEAFKKLIKFKEASRDLARNIKLGS